MDFLTAFDGLRPGATLAPVYLLYGREHLFMERFVDKLARVAETDVLRYDYEDDNVEEAVLELQTVSLFFQQPIVVLKNCTVFLSQGKASGQLELLEAYLKKPITDRILVMTVNGEKLDERKKLTKAAKKYIAIDCNTPKGPAALRVLSAEVASAGIKISQDALTELWNRTGSVSLAAGELEKLSVYAGEGEVTRHDVQVLVTKTLEESVFDWIDHVANGRIHLATSQLVDLQRQGYDSLALIAMLCRQFRTMWFAKALRSRKMSQDEIAKTAKVHPYALRIAEKQAAAFTIVGLETLLMKAAELEYDIKRGRQDAANAVVLLMLLTSQITTGRQRAQ